MSDCRAMIPYRPPLPTARVGDIVTVIGQRRKMMVVDVLSTTYGDAISGCVLSWCEGCSIVERFAPTPSLRLISRGRTG